MSEPAPGAIATSESEGVVVVGATGLLGEALSRRLVALNCPVVMIDVDEGKLKKLAAQLKTDGASEVSYLRIHSQALDPGSEIVEYLSDLTLPVHHLVNAAYPGKDLLVGFAEEVAGNMSAATFFSTHVGFFLSVSTHFCNYLSENGGGSLTNLSSMYARTPPKFKIYENTALTLPIQYGAAKAAIENFSQYLAAFYLKRNVRVNCVAPGGIMANQPDAFVEQYGQRTISGSLLQSSDVLDVIALLASPGGRAITGQTITVDGGFGLV